MKKALFLTFDKTLIVPLNNKSYYLHTEDWRFVNQTVEAIRDYEKQGYVICIICNQIEIAQGIVSEKNFLFKMNNVLVTLEKELKGKKKRNYEKNFINFSYCYDDTSYNFLPKPGMLYDFAVDHELDIINSILIGSTLRDKDIAYNAGIKQYLDVTDLNYDIYEKH